MLLVHNISFFYYINITIFCRNLLSAQNKKKIVKAVFRFWHVITCVVSVEVKRFELLRVIAREILQEGR